MQQVNTINNLYNLLNDLKQQKIFLQRLNQLIYDFVYLREMQPMPQLALINNFLPYLMQNFGLPFCDLMLHYKNILNYYIGMHITRKTNITKNILTIFIKAFNFKSSNSTPADMLINMLKNYDNEIGKFDNEKRAEKNEIEEMYDTLNLTELNEEHIKLLKEKINDFEKRNAFPIYVIQYLKEKVNLMERNTPKNINNLMPNIFNINNINNICNLLNNLQILNYFLFTNNMQTNNNINNIKNGLTADEMKKLKETPLKNREYLYAHEDLNDEEDEYTEFKDYYFPLSEEKIHEIKRQYCGFLNNHGGRIYIGIKDNKSVKGLHLDNKDKETIKSELLNYTNDFYPKCKPNKISVTFIQIKSMQTKKMINDLYVIKILVIPGEPHELFSFTNKGGFISALRLPGQCINLTAEEIYTETMKRGGLLKQSFNNDIRENELDNEENLNEGLNESIFDDDDKTGEETDNANIKKKVIYVVKIENIDKSLKVKKIKAYFNGCGNSDLKFPEENGNSTGFGEMTFSKKETAKSAIKKFKGLKLCGDKKITMKLRKRIKPD